MLIVVTGGSGSGKSAYGERLVLEQGDCKRYYIATMRPWDEECVKKIERHRRMREQKQFVTVECYVDLDRIKIKQGCVVLLECMSNLVANEFYREGSDRGELAVRILKGVAGLCSQARTVIVVTNEVFSDGVDYDEETCAYQKTLALINRELVRMADQAAEVVYGIPLLKKTPAASGNGGEL